jgi:long-subunit fatty acid transport protein
LLGAAGYKLPHKLIVENRIPHALNFGFNVRVSWWLELGLDMRLWFYNFIKRQKITPIYDPNEPGDEPMTKESLTKDKDYKMSWQVAGGALFRPSRRYRGVEILVGGGYDESPLRNRTFSMDNPAMDIVKFTCAVRWRINSHWRLAAAYLFNYFVKRDIRYSETRPPTISKGWGFSHSPSLEMTYRF